MRWPETVQGFSNDDDVKLLAEANKKHPNVKWWWNRRIKDNKTGAYCYICDKMVATFAGNYPPTKKAIEAVQAHRQAHITDLLNNKNDETLGGF